MEALALIGLGSNVNSWAGTPEQTVHRAVARLGRLGAIIARSALYETEPAGVHDQPPFINAALAVRTEAGAEALLDGLLEIEREFGRDRLRSQPKGPRTLDLDLLMMDGLVLDTPRLTLPHPALAGRRFVLAPLAEIAPGVRHPLLQRTIAELLDALPDAGDNRLTSVRRLSEAAR